MHPDLAVGLGIGVALLCWGLGRAAVIVATAWAERLKKEGPILD